jgi:hypothetical protein
MIVDRLDSGPDGCPAKQVEPRFDDSVGALRLRDSPALAAREADGGVVYRKVRYAPTGRDNAGPGSPVPQELCAMVSDDADQAAPSLAAAAGPRISDAQYAELARRLRRMARFGDGFPGIDVATDADGRRFSEELLIHWRIESELGLTEGTPLTSFFGALLTALRTAGQIAPWYDPLPDALRDSRLLSAFGKSGKCCPLKCGA